MSSVDSYSAAGVKSGAKTTLDKAVFDVDVKNHSLVAYVYQAYLDNGRVNLARTKTRGEVVGSTKKPWRQKGTGRARFGSRYNPIWRGGGITFGPTGEENYTKKVNSKSKRIATKQALSLAAKAGKVKVIDKFTGGDGKVKKSAHLLKKIDAKGRILLVVENKDEMIQRSLNNIPEVKASAANYLNVFDIINADSIVITKQSLDLISNWLSPKGSKKTEAK